MDSRRQTLIDRLEVILGELECHYGYMLNDVRSGARPATPEGSALVARIDLAVKCVATALDTLHEREIAELMAG